MVNRKKRQMDWKMVIRFRKKIPTEANSQFPTSVGGEGD